MPTVRYRVDWWNRDLTGGFHIFASDERVGARIAVVFRIEELPTVPIRSLSGSGVSAQVMLEQ
jgi:hypothetical protein